jgi:hypothetical protein
VALFRQSGGHVLVGTPGRLDDVLKRCGEMDTKRLEVGGALRGKGVRKGVCRQAGELKWAAVEG